MVVPGEGEEIVEGDFEVLKLSGEIMRKLTEIRNTEGGRDLDVSWAC